MSKPKGSKNYGNLMSETVIEASTDVRSNIKDIFTTINKDMISVQDFMSNTGLSYDTCARLVRQIKATSDICGVSGYVHRTDYYIYLSSHLGVG